jgi:hypothetical protein
MIYPQGDGSEISFGYGFYRNEAVLLAQAHNPTRGYVHETVVPAVVHVDVVHVTDEAAPGVEVAPLAQFALGGTWVLGERKPIEFHGFFSLASGGKGALLTALYYSAVRSHQAVETTGFPLPKHRAEGGTHHLDAKSIKYDEELKERSMHPTS